jgi:hypothetical protein
MKSRLGAPKAITATARKIACIFYRMLKYGEAYVERGLEHYEQIYKARLEKNLQKKHGRWDLNWFLKTYLAH